MAPVWGAQVNTTPEFQADLDGLRTRYPAIDAEVQELKDVFYQGYGLPEYRVAPVGGPSVYAIRLDYRPWGESGAGRFLVTYHAIFRGGLAMNIPSRTVTLLAITER